MIAGHLTTKNGYWCLILQIRDKHGQLESKWIATHMKVNGNKRTAEAMLLEARRQYTSLGDMRKRTRDTYYAAHFDYADTPMMISEPAVHVINSVCEVFPYAEKVIGNNPIEILLNKAQHEARSGESTAIFTQQGIHGSICIYQLQDDCIAAP